VYSYNVRNVKINNMKNLKWVASAIVEV